MSGSAIMACPLRSIAPLKCGQTASIVRADERNRAMGRRDVAPFDHDARRESIDVHVERG